MADPEFNKESTSFWGMLTAAFWFGYSLFKYLGAKSATKIAEGNYAETLTKGTIMSDEKVGIKETMEALAGLNAIAMFVISRAKDGIDVSDGIALVEKILMDADFKKLMTDAIDGINLVPAELKDLDLSEGFQLGTYEYAQIQEMIKTLK